MNELDHHPVNDMVSAIQREMTHGGKRHADADTVFMGGTQPTLSERESLADFSCSKNWKVIFPWFDADTLDQGPAGFEVVVTDGLTETIVLTKGQLWKRDRASRAVLLFPHSKILVKLNTKGQLLIRPMAARHHDHGYELARESIVGRALANPGKLAVVSMIGAMAAVLDSKTLQHMLTAA